MPKRPETLADLFMNEATRKRNAHQLTETPLAQPESHSEGLGQVWVSKDSLESAISESDFQQSVIDLAQLSGWKVAHFTVGITKAGYRTPMIGDKGYPDITAVKNGQLIFAELKTEKGKPSTDQQDWLMALGEVSYMAQANISVYLWRPSDWTTIERVFRGAA